MLPEVSMTTTLERALEKNVRLVPPASRETRIAPTRQPTASARERDPDEHRPARL